MFIVSIIISIMLYVVTKKMGWDDDILITGLVVCWLTTLALFSYDMVGEYVFGWWATIVNF